MTRSATKILLLIAAAGEMGVTDLARLLVMDEATTRSIVFRLERSGIVRRRTDWKRKPISLDPRHPAATELRVVLQAMLNEFPRYKKLAHVLQRRVEHAESIRHKTKSRRVLSRLDRAALLIPILHPSQAKVLITVASRGAIRMAELVKTLKVRENAVRSVVLTLIDAG